MKVLCMTCKRTNCYLLESNCGWIMIDTDFPETLHLLTRLLKQHAIKISDIKYLIVTHFHPDHADIAQDLKNLGVKLVVHECQVTFVNQLNGFFKKDRKFEFTEIVSADNLIVSDEGSRKLLEDAGLKGEIVRTPGHSDDSVSIIIDGDCAFTGDLPECGLVEAYGSQTIKDSWEAVKNHKVEKIYPAHGNAYALI